MNRICFLSPDVARTEQFVKLLLQCGITKDRIHVVANDDVVVDNLPDAGAPVDSTHGRWTADTGSRLIFSSITRDDKNGLSGVLVDALIVCGHPLCR